MSSATAFASEKALSDEFAEFGIGDLWDALPGADIELPCRTGDADLWFADRPADLELAKELCSDCPIREECLTGAKNRREPWGVWGGEIFERGTIVAKKRARGRPRKNIEQPLVVQLNAPQASETQSEAAA